MLDILRFSNLQIPNSQFQISIFHISIFDFQFSKFQKQLSKCPNSVSECPFSEVGFFNLQSFQIAKYQFSIFSFSNFQFFKFPNFKQLGTPTFHNVQNSSFFDMKNIFQRCSHHFYRILLSICVINMGSEGPYLVTFWSFQKCSKKYCNQSGIIN